MPGRLTEEFLSDEADASTRGDWDDDHTNGEGCRSHRQLIRASEAGGRFYSDPPARKHQAVVPPGVDDHLASGLSILVWDYRDIADTRPGSGSSQLEAGDPRAHHADRRPAAKERGATGKERRQSAGAR